MEQLDSRALILLSAVYYFVEQGLRIALRSSNEAFYTSMRASRKDMVFFGISMGLLISLASTPSCVRGAWSAWHAVSPGTQEPPWFLDEDAKICVTARAILWVSELNRLDLYPLYVIHHTGSIISLLSFLYFQWPVLLFLVIFSTLGSEVPGDLLWMVSAYIDSMEPASHGLVEFKRQLNMFNVAQYAFIRGSGIILVVWILVYSPAGLRTRSTPMQVYAYTLLLLYAAFCVMYVFRQYSNIRTRRLSRPPSPLSYSDGVGWPTTAFPAPQDSYAAGHNYRALRGLYGPCFWSVGVHLSHDRAGFQRGIDPSLPRAWHNYLLGHSFLPEYSPWSWRMDWRTSLRSPCEPFSDPVSGCMADSLGPLLEP
ncbi:hypothetical protein MVEN_02408200 [Mycena venus]|uniref:TLC domain-containing protein n=1 Tax=Mycena venus TaxID=2733690 RepID=A0A8H6X2T3_9AGAR|nr:hypothetical protein MVEN_02408200 [Mycena venus]